MDAASGTVQRRARSMNQCDICEEMGCKDCMNCYLGNPCLNCEDYNRQTDTCKSNGGCAERREE